MTVLYILLWIIAATAALISLVLILLSISAGIRISNSSGKNEIIARYGIFRLKVFQKKEQTEKQKAKKRAESS